MTKDNGSANNVTEYQSVVAPRIMLPSVNAVAFITEAPIAGSFACWRASIDEFGTIIAAPKKIKKAGASKVYKLIISQRKAISIIVEPSNATLTAINIFCFADNLWAS